MMLRYSFKVANYAVKITMPLIMAILVFGIAGCRQTALYERLKNVPNAAWQRSFVPTFDFNISDTTKLYRLYVVIRHTNSYPYRNMWLKIGVQYPQDVIKEQQFELPLAASDHWLGIGMDDIYERRALLLPKPVKFTKTGTIHFTMQHTMRLDPLPQVMQVGIRVEPVLQQQ